jgi:hypothetical protein
MEEMMTKIIGYINPNQFSPCCVIILCQEDGQESFCFYPGGDKVPVNKGVLSLIKESEKFVPEKNTEKIFKEGDIAYLFPSGEVFIGSKKEIREKLYSEIMKPDLPKKEKMIIIDFLLNDFWLKLKKKYKLN